MSRQSNILEINNASRKVLSWHSCTYLAGNRKMILLSDLKTMFMRTSGKQKDLKVLHKNTNYFIKLINSSSILNKFLISVFSKQYCNTLLMIKEKVFSSNLLSVSKLRKEFLLQILAFSFQVKKILQLKIIFIYRQRCRRFFKDFRINFRDLIKKDRKWN